MNSANTCEFRVVGPNMKSFIKSFSFATSGIKHALRNERNFRIQWLCAVLVLLINLLLPFSLNQQIILLLLIAGVLSFELVNSAVERTCDASGQEFSEEKKDAKDRAAGSVLIFSFSAFLILGLMLFEHLDTLVTAIRLQILPWLSLLGVFGINFLLSFKDFKRIIALLFIGLSASFHVVIVLHMNSNLPFLFLGGMVHSILAYAHYARLKPSTIQPRPLAGEEL